MNSASARSVWLFDDFVPGTELGQVTIPLDEKRIADWTAIFGAIETRDRVPSGLLVAAMMEAYLAAIQPRPPGNIHAAQKLFFGRVVNAGDRLQAEVACLSKEMRRERRWVSFSVRLRVAAEEVLRGEIRTIWAK